jgi:hypothetical protein
MEKKNKEDIVKELKVQKEAIRLKFLQELEEVSYLADNLKKRKKKL